MKYFSTLKNRDILCLVVLIAAGFGWILIDQLFLAESWQRMIALVLVLCFLFFLQFLINKPEKLLFYANTIALVSVLFVMATAVLMHVIIRHDFSVKGLIILAITAAIPYGSAGIYSLIKKKRI